MHNTCFRQIGCFLLEFVLISSSNSNIQNDIHLLGVIPKRGNKTFMIVRLVKQQGALQMYGQQSYFYGLCKFLLGATSTNYLQFS